MIHMVQAVRVAKTVREGNAAGSGARHSIGEGWFGPKAHRIRAEKAIRGLWYLSFLGAASALNARPKINLHRSPGSRDRLEKYLSL